MRQCHIAWRLAPQQQRWWLGGSSDIRYRLALFIMVRDLCSTLGTIVNGEPVRDYFRADNALLRAGENEMIAGGVDSPFVFSVFIA